VRPDIRPQLREFLAWYEEVRGRIEAGAIVAPGEQERLTEEASAVAHLLDLLDSRADEPASYTGYKTDSAAGAEDEQLRRALKPRRLPARVNVTRRMSLR
jgi:hypothetical protein